MRTPPDVLKVAFQHAHHMCPPPLPHTLHHDRAGGSGAHDRIAHLISSFGSTYGKQDGLVLMLCQGFQAVGYSEHMRNLIVSTCKTEHAVPDAPLSAFWELRERWGRACLLGPNTKNPRSYAQTAWACCGQSPILLHADLPKIRCHQCGTKRMGTPKGGNLCRIAFLGILVGKTPQKWTLICSHMEPLVLQLCKQICMYYIYI